MPPVKRCPNPPIQRSKELMDSCSHPANMWPVWGQSLPKVQKAAWPLTYIGSKQWPRSNLTRWGDAWLCAKPVCRAAFSSWSLSFLVRARKIQPYVALPGKIGGLSHLPADLHSNCSALFLEGLGLLPRLSLNCRNLSRFNASCAFTQNCRLAAISGAAATLLAASFAASNLLRSLSLGGALPLSPGVVHRRRFS